MSSTTEPAGLLDLAGARRALGGVSPQTVYRLVIDGEFPIVKVRGRTFFRSEDLAAFIERNVKSEGAA